jgi:hypothetical protein
VLAIASTRSYGWECRKPDTETLRGGHEFRRNKISRQS